MGNLNLFSFFQSDLWLHPNIDFKIMQSFLKDRFLILLQSGLGWGAVIEPSGFRPWRSLYIGGGVVWEPQDSLPV